MPWTIGAFWMVEEAAKLMNTRNKSYPQASALYLKAYKVMRTCKLINIWLR